jgi:hypothetical protein
VAPNRRVRGRHTENPSALRRQLRTINRDEPIGPMATLTARTNHSTGLLALPAPTAILPQIGSLIPCAGAQSLRKPHFANWYDDDPGKPADLLEVAAKLLVDENQVNTATRALPQAAKASGC